MKTQKVKLPRVTEIYRLLVELKTQIGNDYRASEDPEDNTPGMSVTVGWSEDGSWSYQTGDNSFTGGAYGHPHWAVLSLYRRSNSRELARDAINQLSDCVAWR